MLQSRSIEGVHIIKSKTRIISNFRIRIGENCTFAQKNLGLIKFLVPINNPSFVFSPYKIKSHFLVSVTFSLSILGNKNVDEIF